MRKPSKRSLDVWYAHNVLLMVRDENTLMRFTFGNRVDALYFDTEAGKLLMSDARDLAAKILRVYAILSEPYDAGTATEGGA